MYKFAEVTAAHIEITNNCQAACPMCPRNTHGEISNPLIQNSNWTYDDFIKIFSLDVIKQFKTITFCGTFGDPILNNYLIKMCEYVKVNSQCTKIVINTNGSARNARWWKDLTCSMPNNHSIFFDLDGVDQHTHSMYRINTDWSTIIANARVVIENQGNAVWHFINFKHNQHQATEAKQLSQTLGFKEFVLKDTRRFMKDLFPVLDKEGKINYYLEQPTNTAIPIADITKIEKYKSWKRFDKIHCYAKEDKEIYIDAEKIVFPCCIIPAFVYTNYDNSFFKQYGIDFDEINQAGSMIKENVLQLIEELGGKKNLNASLRDLKSIINDETWQTIWKNKWQNNGSLCCTAMCSKDSPFVQLKDQFV